MDIDLGAISRRLQPGLHAIFGDEYDRLDPEYAKIYPMEMSEKAFEEDLNMHYFQMGQVKQNGEPLAYAVAGQGPSAYYQHITYALGFIITKEAIKFDQYFKQAMDFTKNLVVSMNQTKEVVAWNYLNRAFNSAQTTFDGVAVGSTAHLLTGGGTYSNTFPVVTPLSELACEQAIINIQGFVDDAGNQLALKEDCLIVPRAQQFEAKRILGGVERYGTADRDINAMKAYGSFPGGIVMSHYLSSATNWFIKTSCRKGLMHFQAWDLSLENDTDFNTKNMRFSADECYSFGITDPRGLYCVQGS
jgi:hypothetical protein